MRQQNEEKMAISMAKIIHSHLESGLGMTGGVAKENSPLDDLRRASDRCLVSQNGFCNRRRHPQVPEICVTECDIPYMPKLEFIRNCFPEVNLISGLDVANTFARRIMHEVRLEDINTCTFNDLGDKALLPVVTGLRPEVSSEIRNVPIEEFRGWKKERPKWILKFSEKAPEYKYYTWLKNGSFGHLPLEEMNKVSSAMYPHATGIENDLDFGILVIKTNPFSPDKKIVMIGGCHWLGTLAISATINLVREMPELGNGKVFKNPYRSMAWLNQLAQKGKLENFQAIFRVTESFALDGRSEVEVYPVGVFSLDS